MRGSCSGRPSPAPRLRVLALVPIGASEAPLRHTASGQARARRLLPPDGAPRPPRSPFRRALEPRKTTVFLILFAVLWGCLDEIHQSFVPYRERRDRGRRRGHGRRGSRGDLRRSRFSERQAWIERSVECCFRPAPGRASGWGAGIRTPIARSRVWSPTVGRPPSEPATGGGGREAARRWTRIISGPFPDKRRPSEVRRPGVFSIPKATGRRPPGLPEDPCPGTSRR